MDAISQPAAEPRYARRAMRALTWLCASLGLLVAMTAQANDERLRLMSETIAYTDVIDAFDGDERIDLNVQLSYTRVRERGDIRRERTIDGERTTVAVASTERNASQLSLSVEVGLFRDLMAFVRIPLVFSDERKLARPSGVSEEEVVARLRDDGDPTPLFAVPFGAPTRAGLDYIALGSAWAVTNQTRRPHLPTWVLRVEGRRPIAPAFRACERDDDDEVVCGPPTRTTSDVRGSSDGLAAVLLETRFSRRFRYAEPYLGLSYQLRWPVRTWRSTHEAAFPVDGKGRPVHAGPETGGTMGVAFIPWENRAAFHRFALDLRFDATHVGTGHGYSPLFDALGTSDNDGLALSRMQCRDGEECARDDFSGVTEIGAHVRYGGQLGVEVQAARYVRFMLGASVRWVTPHALTGEAPCRRGGPGEIGDDGRACAGSVDLSHRGVIDAPGRRFVVRDELALGAYAQAAAMF